MQSGMWKLERHLANTVYNPNSLFVLPKERCACIHAVFLDPLNFSHQDPIPEAVTPSRGPKAGGTLITISGRFLDTGSKEDVQVTVGGVSCTV